MRQLNGNNGFAPPDYPPSGYRPTGAPRANEETANAPAFRFDVVRSVRLHWRLALGVAAAVFVLIVGYALTRTPMYQAESLTYIEPLATKVLSDGSPGYFDPSRYDSYIEQQIQTAQRPDILRAAIKSLPPGVWRYPDESISAAVARLAGSMQVKRVDSSYQLSISATGPDPAGTAAVVNAVTNVYLQQGSKDEHAISDGRIQLLTEERQRLQNELQQAQSEQTSLSASLGVASPTGTSGNPYDMQLAGIRTELVAAEEAHDVAAAQLESMSAQGSSQSPAMVAAADEAIASDSGLSSMKATINQRRANLQSQMAGLTPSNPVYKQDQDEIASVDRNLDAMTAQLRAKAQQQLQDKLSGDLQRTGDVEARLNGQLAHATAQATGAAPKLERATELTADVARLQGSLASVDDALRALELETHGPGLAHLSMAASVPSAPEASRKETLLLAAFPLALLFGIAAAVFARKRDPRAYTAQDVQYVLGFPPLGVMPAENEVSAAVMQEYVLRLAAGVERAYRADGTRSFVFTAVSASTGMDGLVEAVQRKLAELGFSALAADVDSVLRPRREREVELRLDRAGGEGFAATQLERLKHEHDLLLIEARPLLQSAESEYAVCSTDAAILVVESGVTTYRELKDAADLLQRLHATGVAVVLQRVHLAMAEPQFRTAVQQLEKDSRAVAPGVLAISTVPRRRRVNEQREFAGNAVKEPRSAAAAAAALAGVRAKEKPFAERKVAAAASRETMAAEAVRRRLEQVASVARAPQPPAPQEVAATPPAGEQRVWTEPAKEASVKGSGSGDVVQARLQPETGSVLFVPAQPDTEASKESAMKSADDNASKKSIFERMFTRYHEEPVSIIPDEDEDDDEDAAATELADTQVAAAQGSGAALRAMLPTEVAAAAAKQREAQAAPAVETEIAARMESALPVVASFAEAEEQALERALRRPLAPLVTRAAEALSAAAAPVEVAAAPVEAEAVVPIAYAESAEAALPAEAVSAPAAYVEAAALAPRAEAAIAPIAYVEPVKAAPTPAAVNEPKVLIFAERAAQGERAAAADRPAVDRAAIEQRVVLPAPTMRQWEFRQARTMRELAASNVETAARAAEDSLAARRPARPGLVSATGRRVLIEDVLETRQQPAAPSPVLSTPASLSQPRYKTVPQPQPRLVRSWTEPHPQAANAQPARRWAMLSRFDRRFDAGETALPDARVEEDERALGTYGRGPRQS